MRNYEAKKPSYFATPSPQLINALHTSLTQITAAPMAERFQKHYEVSRYIKDSIAKMGQKTRNHALQEVPRQQDQQDLHADPQGRDQLRRRT